MCKRYLLFNKRSLIYQKLKLYSPYQNSCDNGWFAFFLVKIPVTVCFLLAVASVGYAQGKKDTTRAPIQFSGTINFTTNGISPIPAFSLGKPAVLLNLVLTKKRFSNAPEMAFSVQGVPLFFNNFFRYKLIKKPKFEFWTGLNWAISYSYPIVNQNRVDRTIARGERFLWLELVPRYKVSEKVAISSITFSGYNFEIGSVKRINYVSIIGNFTKLLLTQNFYCTIFPQFFLSESGW